MRKEEIATVFTFFSGVYEEVYGIFFLWSTLTAALILAWAWLQKTMIKVSGNIEQSRSV